MARQPVSVPAPFNDFDYDTWTRSTERQCKFCLCTDEPGKEVEQSWLRPCRCDGTIKWVHEACFKQWLEVAPYEQQFTCLTCKFPYRKTWKLKPFTLWRWPAFRFSFWDMVEIFIDGSTTAMMISGCWHALNGRKSLVAQLCLIIMWKALVFTDQRIMYYRALSVPIKAAFFEPKVKNITDESLLEAKCKGRAPN